MKIDEILRLALNLPSEERRALAEALLQSLLPGGGESISSAASSALEMGGGADDQPGSIRSKEEGAAMVQWLIDR